MPILQEQLNKVASIIEDLYNHILLSDIPEDAPYLGYLSREQPFALDHKGYYVSYAELLRFVFALEGIGEAWSEEGIQGKLHELLLSLAALRADEDSSPDFHRITQEWLDGIDIQFKENTCYVPVIGLLVDEPLVIGDVTFHPLESVRDQLQEGIYSSFFSDLHPIRDCIATAQIKAEQRRATEILRVRADQALNILRFIGSLVWHRQPPRHIYIAGQQPKRTSYAIAMGAGGNVAGIGETEYTPLPYKVDQGFLRRANFYGLSFLQSLVRSQSLSSLEQAFLTAVQWYGDAMQDLVPLFAFVKFYVSIETATKKSNERAKQVLPRRVSVLIESWDKQKQRRLEADISDLIDERNAVFHGGKPENYSSEYLAWFARVLAMQTLHHLRLKIESNGFQAKDDLITWVDQQFNEYLI